MAALLKSFFVSRLCGVTVIPSQAAKAVIDSRVPEGFFRAKPLRYQVVANLQPAGNLAHRSTFITVTRDNLEGGIEQLLPGDRLILLSDGVTECPSPTGTELGQDGLLFILERLSDMPSEQLIEALQWELVSYHGKPEFPDDVSALIFDYTGPDSQRANMP